MIMPPSPTAAISTRQLVQGALTAVAAASAMGFFFMDANPSLWLFDKIMVTEARLRRELAGKRIWITGASSGIGAELAQQLAACDAQIVISGRNEERLQLVASQCTSSESSNTRIVPMEVDCSLADMERVLEQVGPMDCVIFNAGIGQQSPAARTSEEETERLFRVNAMAPIQWTQMLLKQPQKPSQFVVTSSVASKFAVPLSASYAASKSAVHTYFTTLAAEHPDLKICLPCPGPVATPLFDAILDDKDKSSSKKKKKKQSKMEAKRCARLMISSMIKGSDTGSHETWIAQQPTLFFLYLHQHLPGLANWLLQRVLGPTRVALWEAGLDIYDPASLGELRKLRKAEAAATKED